MQLEQKILVKTKKKETLEEELKLLEKYKTLTFVEDIFIYYDFFKHIYKTIKEYGIMIYMESDSNFVPHTNTTYYFGDDVKGEEHDNFNIFYTSLYDDSCIK